MNSKSRSVVSDSLQPHGLYSPWNSPGQNTGVGSLPLCQGIFPNQASNTGLPHCRQILYQLSHKGSPRILEWVAYPFSRGSSWPRNQTGVSCIAGRFFTKWAIREAWDEQGYLLNSYFSQSKDNSVACRSPRAYFQMRSIPVYPLDTTMGTWHARQVWIDGTLCLNLHFYTLFKFNFSGSIPTEGISNKWHTYIHHLTQPFYF